MIVRAGPAGCFDNKPPPVVLDRLSLAHLRDLRSYECINEILLYLDIIVSLSECGIGADFGCDCPESGMVIVRRTFLNKLRQFCDR
jgi:hypothetical protein